MDHSKEFIESFLNEGTGQGLKLKVYDFLISECTEEERNGFMREKNFATSKYRIMIDFCLDKGLKKLGWPEKTIVKITPNLDYRALRDVYNLHNALKAENGQINLFVVIYNVSAFSFPPQFNGENSNIKVIKFSELSSEASVEKGKEDNSESVYSEEKTKQTESLSDTYDSVSSVLESPGFMHWNTQREELLNRLRRYFLNNDSFTLFLGAGVSASADMPSWGRLLELLLTKYSKKDSPKYLPCDFSNVLHSCGDSYIIAARYINKIIQNEEERAKIIQEILYKSKPPKESDLIKAICSLVKKRHIKSIVTTNYDQLVELYLKNEELKAYPVAQIGIIPSDVVAVYHVHGSVNDPDNSFSDEIADAPVLSEDDYHELYSKGHHWSNIAILNALQHTHCVFIGLSMTDPNLRRLLETAKYKDTAPHYVFLPRNPLYEGYYDDDIRNEFHYRVQEQIMRALGVNIIWYELRNGSDRHLELVNLIGSLKEDAESNL